RPVDVPRRDRVRDPRADPAHQTDRDHGQGDGRQGMRRWLWWAGGILVLLGLQTTLRGWIGAYNYQILGLVGVNIILAVSLNLINGYTGQFSIGHAGFYAVGAYASASFVKYAGPSVSAAA